MGHVSVLAQLYVLTPWVLWFLHSFQPPTCVLLPDRLSPCCLLEASLFGPPPYFFCDLSLPKRVMITGIVALLSPALPFASSMVPSVALSLALSVPLPLTLSLALSVALSLTALALAILALAALVLAYLALAALALSDLALADLALADCDLADLALAALVGGPGLG